MLEIASALEFHLQDLGAQPVGMAFVHLHTHSEYSLLDGANRIPELVAHVKKLGMDSLAVTDHGNLHAAWSFYEQAKAPRASIVSGVARDGATSVRLHTEPGDSYVFGSGAAERDDLSLSQAATGCYAGQEQWWAHSILFPDDYVAPPAPTPGNWTWGVVFDFHNTTNGGGQANFQINAMSDGLSFQGYAGDPANPVSYTGRSQSTT